MNTPTTTKTPTLTLSVTAPDYRTLNGEISALVTEHPDYKLVSVWHAHTDRYVAVLLRRDWA